MLSTAHAKPLYTITPFQQPAPSPSTPSRPFNSPRQAPLHHHALSTAHAKPLYTITPFQEPVPSPSTPSRPFKSLRQAPLHHHALSLVPYFNIIPSPVVAFPKCSPYFKVPGTVMLSIFNSLVPVTHIDHPVRRLTLLITFSDQYKSPSPYLCSFLQPPVTSSSPPVHIFPLNEHPQCMFFT